MKKSKPCAIFVDKDGNEIVAFYNVKDFTDYTISGGSFTLPGDCEHPIPLTTYVIKGATISYSDWELYGNEYIYKIENDLISGNPTTCNIMLFFETPSKFQYTATQDDGYILIHTKAAPFEPVKIKHIQISRA